jgi:putative tryptophan/tyrosine transport system substrate-binding protein
VRRRAFISLLGGAAAAWPLAARAQQPTGQPLVGLLSPLSAAAWVHIVGAFRRGMRDGAYWWITREFMPAASMALDPNAPF